MKRPVKIAAGLLALWVALAVYWLRSVQMAARVDSEHTEERARREITQPPLPEPSARPVKVRLYRLTAGGTALEPMEAELPLSAEPVTRARQLIAALAALEPAGSERTLPPDVVLLEFYLLPGGAAIADFSGALATAMPSGILSEHLALGAITRTLGENIPGIRRLKIVIEGQEAETLAGHVGLTGFIELRPAAPASPTKPEEKSAAKLDEPQMKRP